MTPAPTLRVLAFDTSTEWLSVALDLGDGRVLERRETGGARASQRLLPLVQELLAQAGLAPRDLGLIGFGAGPGAFTGLRAACSAAQGLGFGLGVPVVPVNTLLAVAVSAAAAVSRVVVADDARMGEIYWAAARGDRLETAARVGAPAQVAAAWLEAFGSAPTDLVLCGNAWREHAPALAAALPPGWAPLIAGAREVAPGAAAIAALARAAHARGEAVDASAAQPIYVRDKVALTTAERAARS